MQQLLLLQRLLLQWLLLQQLLLRPLLHLMLMQLLPPVEVYDIGQHFKSSGLEDSGYLNGHHQNEAKAGG